MTNRITILLCLLFLHSYSQDHSIDMGAELISGFSTKSTLPFWATANKYGAIPNSSYGSLNLYIGQSFQNHDKNWDFAYKGSFTGYLAKENLLFLNELYGSARFKGIILTVGNKYDQIKWQGLSSSNGNFLKSINSRAMPGLNFETNGFVSVGFWKEWFSVKANYGEYWMNDDRIVEDTRAHHKSLHLKFNTSPRFSFNIGLDDWAQWGGISPVYDKQPIGLKDYIKLVYGSSGRDNAVIGDQVNALGNHMGNYLVEFNYLGDKVNWNVFWSHPFEDGSGGRMENLPDALYGLFLDFKKPKALVSHLLFEITYTKNVSGSSPHYRDENGNEVTATGRDQYFKNWVYASGWSYFGKTIGTPYIITKIDKNGVLKGPDLSYNRFIAFNIGSSGYLKKVPYKALLSYVRHYAWFDEEFESTPRQLSGFAEFDISPILKWPVNVEFGLSFDIGNRLPDNLGGFIKLSKSFE